MLSYLNQAQLSQRGYEQARGSASWVERLYPRLHYLEFCL